MAGGMAQRAQTVQHLASPVAVGIAAERLQQQGAGTRIQVLGVRRKLTAGQGAPQASHRRSRLGQQGAAHVPEGVRPAAAALIVAGLQRGKATVDGHGPAAFSLPELMEQKKPDGIQFERKKAVEPPDMPHHSRQAAAVAVMAQPAKIFQNGFALDVLRQTQQKGSKRFAHERPPKT